MKIPNSNLGRTCCVQKLFLTFRTIFVHNMFSPCSAKRRASDKDLPVKNSFNRLYPSLPTVALLIPLIDYPVPYMLDKISQKFYMSVAYKKIDPMNKYNLVHSFLRLLRPPEEGP
jgi:hypothetical protein